MAVGVRESKEMGVPGQRWGIWGEEPVLDNELLGAEGCGPTVGQGPDRKVMPDRKGDPDAA